MMRSRSLARSFVLALALGAPAMAASCGGDSKPAPNATGGGAGMMPKPEPIECGSETCTPFDVPDALKQPDFPACCAEDGQCGLDSSPLADYGLSFGEVCQPKHQPGEANADCPDSAPLMLPGTTTTLGTLKGCCRTETSSCGYLLVIANFIDTELGCVDSAPFLEGGAAPSCEP